MDVEVKFDEQGPQFFIHTGEPRQTAVEEPLSDSDSSDPDALLEMAYCCIVSRLSEGAAP